MAQERIILGIDPGTNIMGYGLISAKKTSPELIALDVLKLEKFTDAHLKLKKIFETTLMLIDQFHPDELAIEEQFFGKNVQSMLKLGRAQGVAMAAALYRNIPVFEYSPRKIKQSITGRGAASKEQVSDMVLRLLNIKEVPKYLDATDAVAVALCHLFQNSALTQGTKYSGWSAFIKDNPDKISKK